MIFLEKEDLSEWESESLEVLYALWATFYGGERGFSYLDRNVSSCTHVIGKETEDWLSYGQILMKGDSAEFRFIWHPLLEGDLDLRKLTAFLVSKKLKKLKWVLYPEILYFLKDSLQKEGFRRGELSRIFEFSASRKIVRSRVGWVFEGEIRGNIFSLRSFFQGGFKANISINISTVSTLLSPQEKFTMNLSKEERSIILCETISCFRKKGFLGPLIYEFKDEEKNFFKREDFLRVGFQEVEIREIWIRSMEY